MVFAFVQQRNNHRTHRKNVKYNKIPSTKRGAESSPKKLTIPADFDAAETEPMHRAASDEDDNDEETFFERT